MNRHEAFSTKILMKMKMNSKRIQTIRRGNRSRKRDLMDSFLSQVTLVEESLVFALVIPLQSFRLRSQSTNRKTLFHLKLICRLCKTRLVWNMQASLVALNWIKWIYPTTINISWFSRSFFGIQLETVYFTST